MENSKNKLINVQGTTDVSNQQQTEVDTDGRLVDELQSYKQKLLSRGNRIKQLTIENNKLKDEIIALRAALNDEYQSRIDDSVLQLNNSNENDLSEDCLLEIFSYLSLEDMMQVERVCGKWYQVSRQWFKQVQTLEYLTFGDARSTITLRRKYCERIIYEKTGIFSFNDLISILHSYGHHIKYCLVKLVGVRNLNKETEKFIFQWIPEFCKNIVDVKIREVVGTNIPLTCEVMATHWKKLEKLQIGHRLVLPMEDNFLELLRNNEQLKTFICDANFSTGGRNSDSFFTYLPTTIEKISITDDSSVNKKVEQLSHFICASKNFTSLQSLELSDFYLSHAVVAAIANIQSLTHLSLNSIAYKSPRSIELIANLKGLKSLELNYNKNLHEDSFINIVESCIQLEWLVITHDVLSSRNMMCLTDKGMDEIAKLKRLKCLTITASHVTIGSIINLCDRLEVLRCYDWRINESDTIKLLKKATNLRFLDLGETTNLSKNIPQAANEIANERKNKILCMMGPKDLLTKTFEVIDTPYFKYFVSITSVTRKIFPNDIRNFIKKTYFE